MVNQVIRTNKFRLFPNATQKSMLFNLFSSSRFIWNETLSRVNNGTFGIHEVQSGKNKGTFVNNIPSQTELIGLSTKLKSDFKFLKMPNDYIQGVLSNLYLGFKEFKKRTREYPNFKSRKIDNGSITMNAGSRVRIKGTSIQIPKFNGTPFSKENHLIKFKEHKSNYPLDSIQKITNMSIKKDNLNRYWITITGYYPEYNPSNSSRTEVGIDLGLKDLMICSDSSIINNSRFTRKYQDKLTILSKRLSKKKLGSKNRIKARIKVAKCHDKIKTSRNHNNHVISRDLINKYKFIGLESLDIKSMMKNKQLSKSIQDVSWSKLLNNIKYKASENQTSVIQIDKYFPSSKMCSSCSSIKSDLKLSDREYSCSNCKLTIDRDINAALNIFREAKRLQNKLKRIKSLLRNTQED